MSLVIFNLQCMHRRVTAVVLCVCVSVCLLPQNQPPTSFLRRLAFPENASFKSSGIICWSPLPSSLPGELSTAKRDSDGFFSARKVYMVSYRSNNTTGSSLIVLHWQRSFLAISACYKMLTQHCTRDIARHYMYTQLRSMRIFVVTLTKLSML